MCSHRSCVRTCSPPGWWPGLGRHAGWSSLAAGGPAGCWGRSPAAPAASGSEKPPEEVRVWLGHRQSGVLGWVSRGTARRGHPAPGGPTPEPGSGKLADFKALARSPSQAGHWRLTLAQCMTSQGTHAAATSPSQATLQEPRMSCPVSPAVPGDQQPHGQQHQPLTATVCTGCWPAPLGSPGVLKPLVLRDSPAEPSLTEAKSLGHRADCCALCT